MPDEETIRKAIKNKFPTTKPKTKGTLNILAIYHHYSLYLTEHNPELEKVYDVGKEIITYTSFDDLVAKIRYLLSNPKEAERIRKRGFQQAHTEHTWEMRFEKIFMLMGLI